MNGDKRNLYRLLMGKLERRRPLGRPIRRLMNNIEMDLEQIEWGGVYCIGMDQDRKKWSTLVNMVMNFQVP
jgi:hypothetical protein